MNQLTTSAILWNRLKEIEQLQWMDPQNIVEKQFQQLSLLLSHCIKYSPHFKERLDQFGLTLDEVSTPRGFLKIPLMNRHILQKAGESIYCQKTPQNHGSVHSTRTSGTSGEPVIVRKTNLNQIDWFTTNLQDHLWHQRDFKSRLCAIRNTISGCIEQTNWGPPTSLLFQTGPSLGISALAETETIFSKICSFQPNQLLIYPSLLQAFTQHCVKHHITLPQLKHIRTIAETLSDENRELAAQVFCTKIEDHYSCSESGTIALQCPVSGLYHIMADNLIVEVLNNEGKPCTLSEIGKIVITDLHNFATPLIRYEIGDFGEIGGPCPCGRGFPTLRKIWGTEKNLLIMPNGKKYWPCLYKTFNFQELASLICQHQLIQREKEYIEVRLVTKRPLTQSEETRFRRHIQEQLGYPFNLQFSYFDREIPKSPSGKFHTFINCLL